MGDMQYKRTNTGYISPKLFFTQLTEGTLGAERLTTSDNLTYLSCATIPLTSEISIEKSLSSYMPDLIATHEIIITPFSRTLQDISYTKNKGFGEKTYEKIRRTEAVLSKIRGYRLEEKILHTLYKTASRRADSPDIIHTGSNTGVTRVCKSAQEQEHDARYTNNLEEVLCNLPNDKLVLILLNGKASQLARPLAHHLHVA